MTLWLLRESVPPDNRVLDETRRSSDETATSRIRCPLCSWQPEASSRWCCSCVGTPEPRFESCGTVWNTFDTRGRCPGCGHQWRWTTCLRCAAASLHEDWYEDSDGSEST
jgi:DNA-directed RNA polymerase subunit RPC12/RpoP